MIIIIIGTVGSSLYTFRKDLIKKLIAENYQVFAFTSEYTEEDLEKIRLLGAIPMTYQLNRGGLNPFADIRATYALGKKIKQIKPDIVFSYFAKPVIFGTLAARMVRVPRVIGMLEGLGYMFTEQPEGLSTKAKVVKAIQIFLYRLALPKLDKLIFLNPDDPKDLIKKYTIPVKEIQILGGIGLNLLDYPYSPIMQVKQPIRFLFIGRLLKEKGIHEFIAAAKIVKNRYSNVVFTVLGAIDKNNPGALSQAQLENYVQSCLIEYLGHVDNVVEWIINSHVFVLPSYREGVPRSTQEAMAIGRPVITTDVPGCRETVIDGVNGFFVPRWNSEKLAEKMIYFIEHPEQIQKMGDEGHRVAVSKFNADDMNARLLNILDIPKE